MKYGRRNQNPIAPDFTATDSEGRPIKLSDYKERRMLRWCLTAVFSDRTAGGIWRSCVRITRNLWNAVQK